MNKYIFENNKAILEKLVWWFPNFSSILKEKIGNTYKNLKVICWGRVFMKIYKKKYHLRIWEVRNEKISK